MRITEIAGKLAASLAFIVAALVGCQRATAQTGYTPIRVEDGGTITGTVKWSGPVPKIPKLAITKNVDVCDPQSQKTRDLERLVISSVGNGVANTVVFLRGVTRGKAMDLPAARQQLD